MSSVVPLHSPVIMTWQQPLMMVVVNFLDVLIHLQSTMILLQVVMMEVAYTTVLVARSMEPFTQMLPRPLQVLPQKRRAPMGEIGLQFQ